ncbi:MAG: hotdog fold thioesterase [Candidatus Calescibacterium sp.]|jgi:uncharacterized protein (TIGR00369 family)|nr:hotdog fold thioesterase [Candidatus Calescibacterium sp.]
MEKRTHKLINEKLCGKVIEIKDGYSRVELETTEEMVADEKGLIHGGFTFSLADYSAMVASNHPYVVLAKANVKFIKPVKLGDKLVSIAKVISSDGNKKTVFVEVFKKENEKETEKVFEGEFLCVELEKHVLDR